MKVFVRYKNKFWTGGITYKMSGNELSLTYNEEYAVYFEDAPSALEELNYWSNKVDFDEKELSLYYQKDVTDYEVTVSYPGCQDCQIPEITTACGIYESASDFYQDPKPAATSFQDICVAADKAKDSPFKLKEIKKLLTLNKKSFDKIQYNFAIEHINNYLNELEHEKQKSAIYKNFQDDD